GAPVVRHRADVDGRTGARRPGPRRPARAAGRRTAPHAVDWQAGLPARDRIHQPLRPAVRHAGGRGRAQRTLAVADGLDPGTLPRTTARQRPLSHTLTPTSPSTAPDEHRRSKALTSTPQIRYRELLATSP